MDTIRLGVLRLLREKDQCYTQKEIREKLKISSTLASYYLLSLEKNKLIKSLKLGRLKNYQLTKKGLNNNSPKALTLSENPRENIRVRSHDLRYKCGITRRPVKWAKRSSWRTVRLKNWTKTITEAEGYIVEITTKNIVYRIKEIYGLDPEESVSEGYEIVRRINRLLLGENPKLVLGEPFVDTVYFYGHHAIQNDPFAVWCKANNISMKVKDVLVDASHGVAELEFVHPTQGDLHASRFLKYASKVGDGSIDTDTLETICKAVSKSRESRHERKPVTWAAIARLYRAVDNITDYYAH